MCASHCAQLLHTVLHRTDLIVLPLTQGQLSRYISELTEVDMDTENGIEFWLQRKTTYKVSESFAVDLPALASQAFV